MIKDYGKRLFIHFEFMRGWKKKTRIFHSKGGVFMKRIQETDFQTSINNFDKFDAKKEDYPDDDTHFFFLMSDFVLDFIDLRRKNKISQKELAEAVGTKQASISRFENLNTKPTLEYLFKVSKAVGGELYINPNGKFTYTIPQKYREAIEKKAVIENTSVEKIIKEIFEIGYNSTDIDSFDKDIVCETKMIRRTDNVIHQQASQVPDDSDISIEEAA